MHDTITVTVRPEYLKQQSEPYRNRYAFAYHITISNRGETTAKLLSRCWNITDGNDDVKQVKGEGVIGKQPTIQPGTSFQYTSGVMLETPIGTMEGNYQMIDENGQSFEADIPLFVLSTPGTLH
jgi:ApaG protein